MWISVAAIFGLLYLPGVIVHCFSMKYLWTRNHKDAFWDMFNPWLLCLTLVLGIPSLSFGFFSLVPSALMGEMIDFEYEEGMNPYEKSIEYGMALLFGVELE